MAEPGQPDLQFNPDHWRNEVIARARQALGDTGDAGAARVLQSISIAYIALSFGELTKAFIMDMVQARAERVMIQARADADRVQAEEAESARPAPASKRNRRR